MLRRRSGAVAHRRHRVVVGDEVERRVVLVLQIDELAQGAEIVAEMQVLAGRLRAGEDDLRALRRRLGGLRLCFFGLIRVRRSFWLGRRQAAVGPVGRDGWLDRVRLARTSRGQRLRSVATGVSQWANSGSSPLRHARKRSRNRVEIGPGQTSPSAFRRRTRSARHRRSSRSGRPPPRRAAPRAGAASRGQGMPSAFASSRIELRVTPWSTFARGGRQQLALRVDQEEVRRRPLGEETVLVDQHDLVVALRARPRLRGHRRGVVGGDLRLGRDDVLAAVGRLLLDPELQELRASAGDGRGSRSLMSVFGS